MAQKDRSERKCLINGRTSGCHTQSSERSLAARPRPTRRRRLVGETLEPRHLLATLADAPGGAAVPSPEFAPACDAAPINASQIAATANATTPLVEYFLTARDFEDQLLPVVNGEVEVGVGIENSFFLEVAYSDLRTFGDDLGAFGVHVNLDVSQPGLLQPVLRETQRIIFGEEIYSASSGSAAFTMEGASQTYVADFADISNEPFAEVKAALNFLGYQPSQYEVIGLPSSDLLIEVRFVDPAFANIDLPNLIVTSNFDVTVPTSVDEFSPLLADGVTPNPDALRFNLDTRSRTFNNNQRFFYLLNRGTIDMASGFIDVGGTGLIPAAGGGVRGLTQDGQFIEPFDVFRLEVFLTEPLRSPLIINTTPSAGFEPLLLFGENQVVPAEAVLVDADASVTLVTAEPTVQQIVINEGASSRSQVTSVTVTFGETLQTEPLQSAFTLVNTSTSTPVGLIDVAASLNDGMTTVTLTFDGESTVNRNGIGAQGNSLADGNYRLHIDASDIRSVRGFEMFRDVVFGEQAVDGLFRLYGDSDGDRDVDGQDYGRFGLTFLATAGQARFNAQLDSDGDGDVDGQDYGRFGLNFLKRI
ncbi:hypothetical protein Enr13x_12230 [Stieleria neptunia]|uniref:Uncharacterized protein n=1 Tax=Stieleria neptunia TaxID=2527979 RepID=A0A518HKL6_9BACT|nr:hypothetical protein [Stieleria neptunia]QDV41385.1 hypothetical protein Enr13x_12230 [Stieleria neptunia]